MAPPPTEEQLRRGSEETDAPRLSVHGGGYPSVCTDQPSALGGPAAQNTEPRDDQALMSTATGASICAPLLCVPLIFAHPLRQLSKTSLINCFNCAESYQISLRAPELVSTQVDIDDQCDAQVMEEDNDDKEGSDEVMRRRISMNMMPKW